MNSIVRRKNVSVYIFVEFDSLMNSDVGQKNAKSSTQFSAIQTFVEYACDSCHIGFINH